MSSLNLTYESLGSVSEESNESEEEGRTLATVSPSCSVAQCLGMSWILLFSLSDDSVLMYIFYFVT